MTYTLHLTMLICDGVQERDGDEIYLKLDGQTIFSSDKLGIKFDERMHKPNRTKSFDFRTCSYDSMHGMVKTDIYTPDAFIFKHVEAPLRFELWESDKNEPLRGADDPVGQFAVVIEHLTQGEDSITLDGSGARYTLSYTLFKE